MEGVIGISGSAEGYIHVVATNNSLQAAVEGDCVNATSLEGM